MQSSTYFFLSPELKKALKTVKKTVNSQQKVQLTNVIYKNENFFEQKKELQKLTKPHSRTTTRKANNNSKQDTNPTPRTQKRIMNRKKISKKITDKKVNWKFKD